ncbi:hypothetical protein N7450_010618 [Penicillium hetheringtonii]|uniref:PHD-type domain-containing protein n=1 Tax=Penicillium hetheringtonii TaxID=911720 RepID=A0AAD6GM58_9EURO|nr:hypothetical protein N7450_010618 [Penicillium hetheringtonii]
MKPIGTYPSPAEYKSVGLKPLKAPKNGTKRASKLYARADDEEDLTTDTPITPVAEEEAMTGEIIRGEGDDPMNGIENTPAVKTVMEGAVLDNRMEIEDTDAEDINDTNLATPLQQTQSPPATAITALADDMASKGQQNIKPDYITVLNSLPIPRSEKYDVSQLKRVLEVAVTRSAEINDDDVALSLVHYWSDISGDDFKLSLIHNIGNDERDHKLELALQTMLRHSTEEANKWYQTYAAENSRLLAGLDSPTDSTLSSAKSLEPETTTFSRADIYRDTSGPKLEEAFLSGKTNTAPLKRAKKPCRVNENSFKRRREWEADPALEDNLKEKRAQLAQGAKSDQTLATSSSIRPQRGQPDDIQHPYSHGSERQDESMLSTPGATTVSETITTPDTFPSGASQPRRQRVVKEQFKAKAKQKETEQQEKEKDRQRAHRPRSLSLDTTVSGTESDVSSSCYSNHENMWIGDYNSRQMPNAINVPENTDYCTICGDEGDLLCCDTCENAFHFNCLRPRVDKKNPPKGDWFCETCVVRNSLTTTIAWGRHKRRKSSFSPPQHIKDYFEGVGEEIRSNTQYPPEEKRTHSFYKSVPTMPRLTKPPKVDKDHSNRTPLYDDPNLTKLMENGHVILCNRCGLSSGGTRPIIRCDYCESRFHLDCLDPPMAKPPNPYEGWLCPNHVTSDDQVIRKYVDGRVQERRPRRPKKATTLSHRWDPEQTWDEDFNAQEDDVGSREIVLDFLSTAKFNKKREDEKRQRQLEATMLELTRQMALEHFAQNGVSLADISNPNPQLRAGIKSLLQNYDSGRHNLDTYDAASSLLGLASGEPITVDEEPVASNAGSENHSVAPEPQEPELDDLETSQNLTSAKPDEEQSAASSPARESTSRPKVRSAPASRRQSRSRSQRITSTTTTKSPRIPARASRKSSGPNSDIGTATQTPTSFRETRKKKRSYAESEPALSTDEPAQKRQHADSD